MSDALRRESNAEPRKPSNSRNISPVSPQSNKHEATAGDSRIRKRRPPITLTLNACTNCKKSKAKCGSDHPICKRCVERNLPDCNYEPNTKFEKDELIRANKRLQISIGRAYEETGSLKDERINLWEQNESMTQILSSLSNNEQQHEILSRLRRGYTYSGIAQWLSRSLLGDLEHGTGHQHLKRWPEVGEHNGYREDDDFMSDRVSSVVGSPTNGYSSEDRPGSSSMSVSMMDIKSILIK